MADIVNLRQRRKAKSRAEKEKRAEDNRVRFGQRKAVKSQGRALRDLDRRRLDSHRIARKDD